MLVTCSLFVPAYVQAGLLWRDTLLRYTPLVTPEVHNSIYTAGSASVLPNYIYTTTVLRNSWSLSVDQGSAEILCHYGYYRQRQSLIELDSLLPILRSQTCEQCLSISLLQTVQKTTTSAEFQTRCK